jgi:hypothetical protein
VQAIARQAATQPHKLSLSPPASLSGGGSGKRPKYRNTVIVEAGVRWDSKKELARWKVLWARKEAGVISQLRRQVRLPLVVNGVKVCDYVADFTFREGGRLVVEDAKGFRTDMYKLKARLFRACYGFDITEV